MKNYKLHCENQHKCFLFESKKAEILSFYVRMKKGEEIVLSSCTRVETTHTQLQVEVSYFCNCIQQLNKFTQSFTRKTNEHKNNRLDYMMSKITLLCDSTRVFLCGAV